MAVADITAAQLKDGIAYAWSGRSVSATDQLAFATRELETCKALVEIYSPQAPIKVKNSAIIRLAGFLAEARFGGFQSNEVKAINTSASFRLSGAHGLLRPFKVHRATAVGEVR